MHERPRDQDNDGLANNEEDAANTDPTDPGSNDDETNDGYGASGSSTPLGQLRGCDNAVTTAALGRVEGSVGGA